MLIYILKSVACMAIFFVFYKLLLEKENMHVFKRFYLLLAIGASLVIPTIVFTEYVVVEPIVTTEIGQPALTDYDYIEVPAALEEDVLDIEPILWTVYFFGLIFFGLKFIKNLAQVVRRIRKNPKQKSTSFIQVLLQENFPPHTFFKYIFLNRKKLESNEIPSEVLLHEETHAKQKHSLDVIIIELLQVAFWFNPLVYLFKKAIKLNHEFLADQAVLDKDIDKSTYQNTLLSYLSPDSQNKYQSKMANAINYSSIKKRFTVMKTHTSKKAMLFRSLLLLPLLALLLLGFSEIKLVEVNTPITSEIKAEASSQELADYNELAKKYNAVAIEKRKIPLDDLTILETIFKKMNTKQKANSQPFPECLPKNIQDGASRELMKEYNNLAKHYNEMSEFNMRIKKKDVERLEYIYGLMSDKQKADAEPFPDFPEPPAPPKAPKELKEPKAVKAPKVKNGEKSNVPPPKAPKAPKTLNEREEAAVIIEKIIEEQDPYDVVGGNMRFVQMAKHDLKEQRALKGKLIQVEETKLIEQEEKMVAQEAKLRAQEIAMEQEERKLEKQEKAGDIPPPPSVNKQNGWVVSSGANRDSRMDEEGKSIPPVAPTIGIHANTDNYSKELNNAIQDYLKKNKVYEETVDIYLKKGLGNRQDLWNTYNEAMKLYVNYYNLAQAEGNFVQPIPAYKKKADTKSDIPPPPNPLAPKSPLDHVIEMAKKDATFYYEGKEISSDKAINLLKKNSALNIDSRGSKTRSPVVRISKQPISIDN